MTDKRVRLVAGMFLLVATGLIFFTVIQPDQKISNVVTTTPQPDVDASTAEVDNRTLFPTQTNTTISAIPETPTPTQIIVVQPTEEPIIHVPPVNMDVPEDYQTVTRLIVIPEANQSLDNTFSNAIIIPELNAIVINEPDFDESAQNFSGMRVVQDDFVTAAGIPANVNDPYFTSQWNLNALEVPQIWENLPETGNIVKVAVIDSGICYDHPDLNGIILPGKDFVDNDNLPADEFGHGCSVAGVIGAGINNEFGIAGITPNVNILPYRVLDENGIGLYSNVAAAIVEAVNDGAEIINLSLGGVNPSVLLEYAIDYAISHNVRIVAAAGNSGGSNVLYPAAYNDVISVGSVNPNLEISSFSNGGRDVDTFAPGESIYTTSLNGGVITMDGTSLAAAQISGLYVLSQISGYTVDLSGSVARLNMQSGIPLIEIPDLNPLPETPPPFEDQDIPGGMFEDTLITYDSTASSTNQFTVTHQNALSISVHFTEFDMSADTYVTISNPDGSQSYTYPNTDLTIQYDDDDGIGSFWTVPILGETAIVSVVSNTSPVGRFNIDQYIRGVDAWNVVEAQSGACNVDVICPAGDMWRDEITSIVALSVGGSPFCTGSLVNNTAMDGKPYILTAEHCNLTSANDENVVAYFFYENSTCREPGSASSGQLGNGFKIYTSVGATWRASYAPSDFTLLELNNALPDNKDIFYLGWDRRDTFTTSAIGIHHPSGQEKRISYENQNTSITSYGSLTVPGDGTHLRVADWDLGTTEGGSSGSPLLSPAGHVIGQLHGGTAACGNNASDWYGRIAESWDGGNTSDSRLSDWLDPLGTGALVLEGTYFDVIPTVDTFLPLTPTITEFGLGTSETLEFNFNTHVNLTEDAITIACSPGGNIPISGLPSSNTRTVTITPQTNYPFDALCTATLHASLITDSDGTPLDGDGNGIPGDNYLYTFSSSPVIGMTFTATPSASFGDFPNPAQVIQTFEVTEMGTLKDINININISHTRVSDVDISLVSPQGTVVWLLKNRSGASQEILATFDQSAPISISEGLQAMTASFRPEISFLPLYGEPIQGTWTIYIIDEVENENGVVNQVNLELVYGVNPPPYLVSNAPSNADKNIQQDQIITLGFNEATSISADAFSLVCSGNSISLSSSIALPASDVYTIYLTPNQPLPKDVTCNFTIKASSVLSVEGVSFDGNGDGIPGDDGILTFETVQSPTPTPTATFTPTATPEETEVTPTTVTPPVIDPVTATPEPPEPGEYVVAGQLTSGVIRPNFTWGESTNADWYHLIIVDANDPTIVFLDIWVEANTICSADVCSYSPDKNALFTGLLNGTYNWWIQSWVTPNEFSDWEQVASFTVNVPAPSLAGVNIPISAENGQFVLSLPNDNESTWYHVYIASSDGIIPPHDGWYDKETLVCTTNLCTLIPDANPVNGEYTIYIQSWGPGGFNDNDPTSWQNLGNVTLNNPAPELIESLTVTFAENTIQFNWSSSDDASWYQIWAGTTNFKTTKYFAWQPAIDLGCNNQLCSLTLNSNLFDEQVDYTWFVRAWGPGGFTAGGTFDGWNNGGVFQRQ